MSAKKSVLIISSEFPPNVGGIGNHSYNLARSLSAEGYNVTVIADIINVDENEQRKFKAQQSFSIKYVPRKKVVLLSYLDRIVQSIKLASKQDIVICSGKFPLWLSIILRFFYKHKKIIDVVHGSELDLKSSLPKKLTNYALSKANTIIAVSHYTQTFLPTNLPSSINKTVIHNGINIEEFRIGRNSSLKGEPSLITIGSVTPRKGQENVINALPEIRKSFPNAFYHIVGKPDIKEKLENIADKQGTKNVVSFYGAVDRSTLLKSLSGATIKLMLSNHTTDGDFEGFGIAVLEANAFGIPVIGSKNSGIEDAIFNERTGLLVDPKSPQEITSAIKAILDNYNFFSFNAKQWAYEHDWKTIVKQYESAINLS